MNVRTWALQTLLGAPALSALMGAAGAVQLLLGDIEVHLAETGDAKALKLALRIHRHLESVLVNQGARIGMDLRPFSGGVKPPVED